MKKQVRVRNPIQKFLAVLLVTTLSVITTGMSIFLPPFDTYAAMPTYVVETVPTPTPTPELPRFLPKRAYLYQEIAHGAAKDCDISTRLFFAIITVESMWDPQAKSNKNAYGLTQLMPITARHMGVNRYDIKQNLMGGACYFRQMKDRFNSTRIALWAYNTGPGNVEKGKIPKSTREYADKIMGLAGIEE